MHTRGTYGKMHTRGTYVHAPPDDERPARRRAWGGSGGRRRGRGTARAGVGRHIRPPWAAVGAPSSLLGDGAAASESGGGSRLWWPWPSLAEVVGIGALVIGLAGRAVKGRGAEMV